MHRAKTVVLGLFLAVLLLMIAPPSQGQTPQTSGSEANVNGSSQSDLRSEVEQLSILVREQQKRIAALEAERQPGPTASVRPSDSPMVKTFESPSTPPLGSAPSAPSAPQNPPAIQSAQAGSSDERIRNLERQIKGIGPISFSGDIRLRGEPFFGGPTNESLDRARGRIRVRFNANADLGSQFRTGLTLASGDINDPTTTNQTLTGFYTRKTIALDQAFVEYTPKQFKPLTLTGGKFRYPWFNTELTWDKDLNPEGVAEALRFNLKTPVLKRLAFIGFQLPFAEVAGTSSTHQRISQQITYGGQVQTSWQFIPHVTLNAYSGFYDFRGTDSIALALARASSKNPQTPLTGALPLATGNPVQNSTFTTTATNVVTIGGISYPTGVSSVAAAQFGSKFALFDSIARFDIDTGRPRAPIMILGDYVQNTSACGNLANIIAVPANTDTQTFKQTVNAPCNSHHRRGYWMEARVGRLQEKHDFQVGYMHLNIDREAVLGNFNYSDIRQGTNVTQHRIDTFFMFEKNVQLGFTALVGRPLGTTEPWLTRLQFDVVYVF